MWRKPLQHSGLRRSQSKLKFEEVAASDAIHLGRRHVSRGARRGGTDSKIDATLGPASGPFGLIEY
jgi:hypothetical protein